MKKVSILSWIRCWSTICLDPLEKLDAPPSWPRWNSSYTRSAMPRYMAQSNDGVVGFNMLVTCSLTLFPSLLLTRTWYLKSLGHDYEVQNPKAWTFSQLKPVTRLWYSLRLEYSLWSQVCSYSWDPRFY